MCSSQIIDNLLKNGPINREGALFLADIARREGRVQLYSEQKNNAKAAIELRDLYEIADIQEGDGRKRRKR